MNRTNLYTISAAAAAALTCASAYALPADSTLQQSMTLERDFAPIVRDANKIQTQPTVEQPSLTQRHAVRFADWLATPASSTDLTRLPAGRVFDTDHVETNRGYLDFALGNYWNTDLRAGYYLLDTERTQLLVSTDWHATEHDFPPCTRDEYSTSLPKWNQSYLSGAGAIQFTRRLQKLDWHVDVRYTGVNHTLLNYDLILSRLIGGKELRQKTSDLNFRLAFDNLRQASDFRYEVEAETGIFSYDIPEENREVQECLRLDLSKSLDEDLRGGLKAQVEARQYQHNRWTVNGQPREALEEGIALRLTPYVAWELGDLHLDLGARADFLSDAKHHVGIAPDVHATYALPARGQTLYAYVTGGVESPTVSTLMRQMPFYLPIEEHLNPWTLTDATVGYSYAPTNAFTGRLYVGAAYTLDALVAYATDCLTVGPNQRGVGLTTTLGETDDLQLKAGAEVTWAVSKYFSGEMGATIFHHSEARAASQRANFNAEVALRSHPVKALLLELKYEGRYDRAAWYLNPATDHAEKLEMDDITDLSLSGRWAFSPNFSVHADLRNLLNEEQETWLGAPGQKFNFQVGLSWKF
jgi:outer membrane receptor protein involved in Fe transport